MPAPLGSRLQPPIGIRAHERAGRKRDRATTSALRRAVAGDAGAVLAVKQLKRWLKHVDTTLDLAALESVMRLALHRPRHVDAVLVARLEQLVGRIDLHIEAARLRIKPDDLAEARMVARTIAAQLTGSPA